MNRHKKRKARHTGGRGKYIFGGIAAALTAVLAAAAVLWIVHMNQNTAAKDAQTKELEQGESKAGQDAADRDKMPEKMPDSAEDGIDGSLDDILDDMTLEEKVCQLFMITPEALTGVGTVTQAGEATKAAIDKYPVGGVIYFAQNLKNPGQTKTMLANTKKYAEERTGLPVFLSVDEEGGQVARVGSNPAFGVEQIGDMSDVGSRGDTQEAYKTGSTIGAYLRELGFNMDAAPDADVLTNPENQVVRYRSFGSDPRLVADMAEAELKGLRDQGILGLYKHFPGHGGTAADSHEGYAYVDETLEELKNGAFIPFQDGIDGGIPVIMVSHIACPNVTGDNTPATFSKQMLTDILRNDMGFDGMIITDALNMGAVTEKYSSARAAVEAVNAGADMLLMPEDFQNAYQGLLDAVKDGTVTEDRIDASVRRILEVKLTMEEKETEE